MTAVVLCEKKSQADAMMAAIGLRRDGAWMSGSWAGTPITVVWARGHLFELAPPEEAIPNITWTEPDSLLPIPSSIRHVLKEDAKKQYKDIADALSKASECWIATDPDREGEAIGRTIIAAAKFKGPIRRIWLTGGMDAPSIKKAFADLKPDAFSASMFEAQRARAIPDWQSQILTRAMTMAARHGLLGPNLGTGSGQQSVASVGRVQTATLKIVYDRDLAIEAFRPTTFYTPWITVQQGAVGPAKLEYQFPKASPQTAFDGLQWYESDSGTARFILVDKAVADAFNQRVKAAITGPLTLSVDAKKIVKKPPVVFSLTTLQATMNKRFKLTAAKVLEALNELYLKGYVSYPRTERDLLPMTAWADAKPILTAISAYPEIDVALQAEVFTSASPTPPPCYTTKEMEHHGLMPTTTVPNPATLTKEQGLVYASVVKRYVQAHYPAALFDKANVTLKIPAVGLCGESESVYGVSGEACTSPGWMGIFGTEIKDTMPALKSGSAVYVDHGSATGQTKPPPPFTEATLLMAMLNAGRFSTNKDAAKQLEKVEGIGTPATRDKVIETLFAREYIERVKAAKAEFVRSTPKGRDLCRHAPPEMVSVDLTASLETELSQIQGLPIAEARSKRQAFVEAQTAFATTIVQRLSEQIKTTPGRQRDPNFSGVKPTQKMVAFAKKLAEEKGIKKLPPKVLTDSAECRKFIESNRGTPPKRSAEAAPGGASEGAPKAVTSLRAPSEKQVAFARSLAAKKGIEPPQNFELDVSVCRQFIDAQIGNKP